MTSAWRLALGFGLLLVLPCVCHAADEPSFEIRRAELQANPAGQYYALNADIDFRFSEPAIDALRNGVTLGLTLRLEIKQENGWWWEGAVYDEKLAVRIHYHALTKLYQIVYQHNDTPRNFVSLNALLEAMGSIRGLPVMPLAGLEGGQRYRASLEVGLDIESLPLPLRPVAYITPAWHLHSLPYQWTFAS